MKRIVTTIFAVLSLIIVGCVSVGPSARDPRTITSPKISFAPKEAEVWTLSNGLIVYYLKDDELPIVSASLFLPGGSLFEPANMVGIASATGSLMRDGGVVGMAPDALDSLLDSLGAKIESNYSGDYGIVSFRALSSDFDRVSKLFADVVMRPAFDQRRLELWKALSLDAIKRRPDDPDGISSAVFQMAVYGASSPYARLATSDSIARINAQYLRAYHKLFVRPQGSRLAITGALSSEQAKAFAETCFGSWQNPKDELPSVPAVDESVKAGVYIVNKPFNQSTIVMGHMGPPRVTDDMLAIGVYNKIFGLSSFDSILFNEIRSRQGLAYSVYGGLLGGVGRGLYEVALATKNEEVLHAVSSVKEIIRAYQGKPLDPGAIENAKASLTQAYVFKFEKPEEVVKRKAMLDQLGFPKDYDATYLAKVAAVSPQDTAEVSNRWISPEKVITVIVGQANPQDVKKAVGLDVPVYDVQFGETPKIVKTY